MVKRPFGLACLAVCALLYLLVRVKPAACEDYGEFAGKAVTVTGKVIKKETVRQKDGEASVLYLRLSPTEGQGEGDAGPPGKNVMCYLKAGQSEPEMGSTVRLTGKLSCFERASNPGQFDAYSYYQISGISYRLNQATILAKTSKYNKLTQNVYLLREFLAGKLSDSLPEKEASVMRTMLLGDKSGMDKELKALYQRNGIAHILAISGLHISMLGMGLYRLLRRCAVPMKVSAALSAAVMIFYGMMTGFSVSAVRAIIMFCLHMAAVLMERTYDSLTAAAAAAVLILLKQPLYLGHSGFIFSFGCVLGIGLVLPALTEAKDSSGMEKTGAACGRRGLWKKGAVIFPKAGGMLLPAFAIAVVTLPIYLWFYYQFPTYSMLLNLLIIPMMSLLMGAGLLLLLSGMLCPFAELPFVFVIKGILKLYEAACGLCERLPGNILTPGRPEKWRIVCYLLLLVFLTLIRKRAGLAVRWGIAALSVLLITVRPQGGLRITFLDVGQGDCICIENGHGKNYLVDGGSSSVSSVGEYRIIPFLKFQGISRLEAVFVTHPDEDHCNGVGELLRTGALQGIRVGYLVLPDIAPDMKSEAYLKLEQTAQEAGVRVSYISRGQKTEDGGLTLACLHPPSGYWSKEANEYSIVLALNYGSFSAMLTGDVEGAGEQSVTQLLQGEEGRERLTVLKAAHHGSKGSTSEEFLSCLNPVYTVISCGRDNSYGHPHTELMERVAASGSRMLITYETGAATFATDGRRVKIDGFLME